MKNQGYSLIELMLALLLSFLLILGLIKVYLLIKNNFNSAHALFALQIKGEQATEFLSARIRLAGYSCQTEKTLNDKLIGYSSNQVPFSFRETIKNDTDVIIIQACLHYQNRNQLIKMAYYLGKTHRVDKNGSAIFSLFQKPLNGEREEIIENIKSLKILYGVMQANRITHYLPANEVVDFTQIKSVIVKLIFYNTRLKQDFLWIIYTTLREQKGLF